MVSKRRRVSIPLKVKNTAEGQTHTSARQPGLEGGRSEGWVISHTTEENSLHRQISRLGCYERGKAVCEAIGVSPLGRKSGGGLELPVKAPAGAGQ